MEAVGGTFLGLTTFTIVSSLLGFYFTRESPIIAKRSLIKIIPLAIGLIGAQLKNYLDVLDVGDCRVNIIVWRCIFFNIAIVQAVRMAGAIFAFKKYKRIIYFGESGSSNETEGEEIKDDKLAMKYDKLSSDKYFVILYCAFHSVQIFILFCGLIYALVESDSMVLCDSAINLPGGVYSFLVVFGAILYGLIELRKIHDAYLIKTELFIWAIISVFPGLPGLIFVFIDDYSSIGDALIMLGYFLVSLTSFAMPFCFAFYELRISKTQSSSSLQDVESNVVTLDSIISNEDLLACLEYYIRDIQYAVAGRCLQFYIRIQNYKKLPDAHTTGTAWLICQKYLKVGCYIEIPEEIASLQAKKAIYDQIEAEVNLENPREVSKEIFDTFQENTAKFLQDCIIAFRKSDILKKHLSTKPHSTTLKY